MYVENQKNLDPRVRDYLRQKVISTFQIKKVGKTTEYKYLRHGSMTTCYGLLSKVKKVFYPDFDPYGTKDTASSSRAVSAGTTFFPHKKRIYTRSTRYTGSNRKKGDRVDKEIALWTARGGGPADKKWDRLTKKLIETLNMQKHTPQAAQVPVVFMNWEHPFGRATCADLITTDANGRLCMWEVKTGMPVQQRSKGITFKHVQDANGKPVPCTTKDMWQFQLHFTEKGLKECGLPIESSKVIMVCNSRKNKEQKKWDTTSEVINKAPWIKQLEYHE